MFLNADVKMYGGNDVRVRMRVRVRLLYSFHAIRVVVLDCFFSSFVLERVDGTSKRQIPQLIMIFAGRLALALCNLSTLEDSCLGISILLICV